MTTFNPGEVVGVMVAGIIEHKGIVSFRQTVISNSMRAGGVVEQSLQDFGGGGSIRRIGHLGDLPSNEVAMRAESRIGQKWNLWSFNCEHFVLWAHGLEPRSPQVASALGTVSLVALALAVARY